ncbi:MAG: Threonine synthase [Firmicutes bacterium ADurb.Bin506]|nr:MAG: Threonine synthase [Firmicutes bacterium ADurb.Bin506]
MHAIGLRCDDCGKDFELFATVGRCPACGGLLEFEYDYEAIARRFSRGSRSSVGGTIWRWMEVLPIRRRESIVTLGEGGSPLVPSLYVGPKLGLTQLYFKNDTMMPTGSFKDRGFAVAMSWAKEWGVKRGFTYTSGNAGHSFAAYARRIGLQGAVLMNSHLDADRYDLQAVLGYPIIKVEYDSFAEIDDLMSQLTAELGSMQFVNFINPVRHEGMKTYAYELFDDLDGSIPDHVVQPMGTGGGYWGAYKGFTELRRLGLTDELPCMHVVQPAATPPVVRAFETGLDQCVPTGDASATIARSIASDDPIGKGRRVLRALKATGGRAIAVDDDEIKWAMIALGSEGIWAEPAGAASVAALLQLVASGAINPNSRVVCVITGSGLKEVASLPRADARAMVPIPSTVNAVTSVLRSIWPADASAPSGWACDSENPGA